MSGGIILPGPGSAPEPPENLTREGVILALADDCVKSLVALSPSKDLRAATLTRINRAALAIYTNRMPPTRHVDYEVVSFFQRKDPDSPWEMTDRWVRLPGEREPLMRLTARGEVMPMGDQ